MDSKRVGVLIAGIGGYTGATFALGIRAHQIGIAEAAPAVTGGEDWTALGLATPDEMVVSGWDTSGDSLYSRVEGYDALPQHIIEALGDDSVATAPVPVGISRSTDFTPEQGATDTVGNPMGEIRSSIRRFRKSHNLERVVVVILLPPEVRFDTANVASTPSQLVAQLTESPPREVMSSLIYVTAAILEGCPVIDFTANASLSLPSIVELAEQSGVALAGRDGSTGETILKHYLADFFRQRNLIVRGWYGTNILGNPDGLALMDPERRVLKMSDKRDGLSAILGYPVEDHVVSIDYFAPRGDRKEFWDTIDLETWFGADIQLKVNWIGRDSLLAGPILLDLVRIMASDIVDSRAGIVQELGYFFKHPLGTPERSPLALWESLHSLTRGASIGSTGH